MKSTKLLITALLVAFGTSAFAQSVIMEENFQSFKEQGWRAGNDTVMCGKKKIDSKSNFKVNKVYGDIKVSFAMKKAGVAPECEAKKTPSITSTGYVEINKKGGELIVGTFPYISSVTVTASATGDVRGFAIWKSIDGAAWEKVGEYIGAKSEGADSQYGFSSNIKINESNVSLKFTPTICGKDEPALQTFRIHDIKVFGK